jgi:cation:H+ antiporter
MVVFLGVAYAGAPLKYAANMDPAAMAWLKFAACAAAIGVAGAALCRYADVIAEKTRLSATWIGLLLLATVTSLPELVTGASAVTIADVPDIAVGDALGSCVFNLAMLVVVDFLHRRESIYRQASQGHVLSAAFGVALIGFVGLNILIGERAGALALGHVGAYTPVIVALYVLAMRMVFAYERAQMQQFAGEVAERYSGLTLRQAASRYAAAAAVVAAAGAWLPFIGAELAEAMGWRKSFVGTLFVAGATSLPELAVTVSALRLGALDMAIGNLLGSNLFDVLVLAIDDLAYTRGPLLADVSPTHAATALSAMAMSGVAIVGLRYRPGGRVLRTVGWTSLALFALYLLNSYFHFLHGD